MLGDMGTAQQRTLRSAIGCPGGGLHCGQKVVMTRGPASPHAGFCFRRLAAGAEIRARWNSTIESSLSTVLSNGEGICVSTIEHLLAALAGSAIDNAIVELDGPEVPIMDGSAAPFLHLIERAGRFDQDEPRRAIKILKSVAVSDGEASAALLPDHGFSLRFQVAFPNP